MRLVSLIAAAAALIALAGQADAAPQNAVVRPAAVAPPVSSEIVATGAVIRPAPRGLPTTAAYVTLTNHGGREMALKTVACDCAGMVMAHRSEQRGGVMHMGPADRVAVPPHGQLVFAPGGLHLMLMDLKRAIGPGDRVPMTLTFEHGPPMTVVFTAKR